MKKWADTVPSLPWTNICHKKTAIENEHDGIIRCASCPLFMLYEAHCVAENVGCFQDVEGQVRYLIRLTGLEDGEFAFAA